MNVLGIDIGSSSVKVAIVRFESTDSPDCHILCQVNEQHFADVGNLAPNYHEQRFDRIVEAFLKCMKHITTICHAELLVVNKIAVCGQMHGLILWNSKVLSATYDCVEKHFSVLSAGTPEEYSTLITWQDRRADQDFLGKLPASHNTVERPHAGYGFVSLLWLAQHDPAKLSQFDSAGTVADFIVTLMCGRLCMSTQNAVSWGYFDPTASKWDDCLLKDPSYSAMVTLLPAVMQPGQIAGCLRATFCGIPAGVPVLCAFGDFQATVFSNMKDGCAVLNISTSAQLCFGADFATNTPALPPSVNVFAYLPPSKHLVVAASLNGGNVLDRFVDMLLSWIRDLTGLQIPLTEIWNFIASRHAEPKDCTETELSIVPRIFGERYAPDDTGSVSNLRSDNLALHTVVDRLLHGIIRNLTTMMPLELLKNNGVHTIILTGQAVKAYFLPHVRTVFKDFRIVGGSECDAAYGAAMFAWHFR